WNVEIETAKRLHDAGVRVAFAPGATGGEKPWEKVRANVRKVIDAGMSADAALAALTTTPAALLGADGQRGRIAPGRPAHLAGTTGDFQVAGTQVRMVFADGVRFEFDAPAGEAAKQVGPTKPDMPAKVVPFVGPPTWDDTNTEIEADRVPTLRTGGNVLIRGA